MHHQTPNIKKTRTSHKEKPAPQPINILNIIFSLLVFSIFFAMNSARGEEPSILKPSGIFINGLSHHFKDHGQQSVNPGIGIYYYISNKPSWLTFADDDKLAIEFDAYSDSYSDFGYAGGISWKRSLIGDKIYLGLKAGLIHEDVASKNSWYLIPYIVPFAEIRNGSFGIRSMLVPPVGNITDGYVTLQFMVDF
jgi:hypothetical protein